MKIDIKVTKAMTINTGNYENVRPEITLTAKDVENENVKTVYKLLSEIADDMFNIEIASQIALNNSVKQTRPTRFAEIILEEHKEDIENEIKDLMNELKEI